MDSLKDVRVLLADYLAGKVSLDSFEDAFVQKSWNVHRDAPEARGWVSAVELLLSEFSSGHLLESRLRDELRPFATNYVMSISFDGIQQPQMESGIKWSRVVVQIGAAADTLPSVVFG